MVLQRRLDEVINRGETSPLWLHRKYTRKRVHKESGPIRLVQEGLGLPAWTSSSGMRTKRSPGADSRLAKDASDSAYCCRFATTNTNEEYGSW